MADVWGIRGDMRFFTPLGPAGPGKNRAPQRKAEMWRGGKKPTFNPVFRAWDKRPDKISAYTMQRAGLQQKGTTGKKGPVASRKGVSLKSAAIVRVKKKSPVARKKSNEQNVQKKRRASSPENTTSVWEQIPKVRGNVKKGEIEHENRIAIHSKPAKSKTRQAHKYKRG